MNPGKQFMSFDSKSENPHFEGVFDIEPQELQEKLNNVKLIDVRQHSEYTGELGHIPAAELMVLDTLPEKIAHLPKDQTVVFICHSGGRSARATAFALMNGFESVFNLRGGMLLWNDLKLPINK
jgi:rhodanese-related sulfurtransferase